MAMFDVANVILMGLNGVGKTTMLDLYEHGHCSTDTDPTFGSSFRKPTVNLKGAKHRLHICDTSGMEAQRTLLPLYYPEADTAIWMYDITNKNSFAKLKEIRAELERKCESTPEVIFVIGNKTDLHMDRQVSTEEGKRYARVIGAKFMEISAFQKKDVIEVFTKVCKRALKVNAKLAERMELGDMITEVDEDDKELPQKSSDCWRCCRCQ